MQPFQPAKMPKAYFDIINIMETQNVSSEVAHEIAAKFRKEKVFLNDLYQVNVAEVVIFDLPGVHLSIKRRDREIIHDWRHLQQIKNMLVGEECEGFELYPAESRLTDEANQYHLWCFKSDKARIPVGNTARFVSGPEEAAKHGAKQRPFGD